MPGERCIICGGNDGCLALDDGSLECFGNPTRVPASWVFVRERLSGGRVFMRDVPMDQPEAADDTGPEPVLVKLGAVDERRPEWLWHSRIERGALNLLVGYPGVSKSILAIDIAARTTTGAAWPNAVTFDNAPGNVLFMPAEDSIAKAIKPRAVAARADLDRITVCRAMLEDGRQVPVNLQRHLRALTRAVREVGDVRLLVLDPLNSFLGDVDSNSNEQTRRVLEPLCELAEDTSLALLVLMHTNKMTTQLNALDRVSGTRALTALARTVAILGTNPEDKHEFNYTLAKVSHAARPETLAYQITTDDQGRPYIAWMDGTADADAEDVLQGRKGNQQTARDRAAEWLRSELASGPVPSADLKDKAAAVGISSRTLDRAKETIGVAATQQRDGDKVVGWLVSLPPEGETL